MNPAVASVSAFFPCYNDAPTIARMVETVARAIDSCRVDGEIIVVNDGSADESAEVLAAVMTREPRLRVVTHEVNRGYGGALLSGFASATLDWVFYTDGDGQFDPGQLVDLVEAASDDVDVVQGYKTSRADNLARRIIGRSYHRFVAFAFGLRVQDTDCDFRLIRRAAIDQIELVHSSGVICVELVRKLQDSGARFVEVPVDHYPREHGKSQFFRLSNVIRSLADLGGLWINEVLLRRFRRRASHARTEARDS